MRDADGNILATYTDKPSDANFYLDEQNIYGSSRLGIFTRDVNMTPSGTPLMCAGCPVYYKNTRGKKNYEMTNHLGNVLTTISDSREAVPVSAQVDYFKPVITSVSDYYPFGMNMPGRLYTSSAYRFGFNGKENDNEVKGNGNWQDYGMRMYDPRVIRFPNLDPLTKKFPELTPYQFGSLNPIWNIDLDGLEGVPYSNPLQPIFQGFAMEWEAAARWIDNKLSWGTKTTTTTPVSTNTIGNVTTSSGVETKTTTESSTNLYGIVTTGKGSNEPATEFPNPLRTTTTSKVSGYNEVEVKNSKGSLATKTTANDTETKVDVTVTTQVKVKKAPVTVKSTTSQSTSGQTEQKMQVSTPDGSASGGVTFGHNSKNGETTMGGIVQTKAGKSKVTVEPFIKVK